MKIIILILMISFSTLANSQGLVGINTKTPSARIDINSHIDNNIPNSQRGFLIPRVSTMATNGLKVSQLVLEKNGAGGIVNYHYWDGSKWVQLIKDKPNRNVNRDIYSIRGTGFKDLDPLPASSSNTYFNAFRKFRQLSFGRFESTSADGFELNSNNNSLKVGKAGRYLLEVSTSLKRSGTSDYYSETNFNQQDYGNVEWVCYTCEGIMTVNYTVRVRRTRNGNTTTILTGGMSHSTEGLAYANTMFGGLVNLRVNDILTVEIQRNDADNTEFKDVASPYETAGTNSLTLTYFGI